MIRSRVAILAMSVLAATLGSCGRGDEPPLYPVYGKVTYRGQPAAGAYVVLVKDDAPTAPGAPAAGGEPPSATVEEDGRFTVTSGEKGDGAPVGKYKVMITWRTGVGADAAKAQEDAEKKKRGPKGRIARVDKHAMLAPDRLKGRYSHPDKPVLTAEVKPETNNLPPFEVTD